MSLGGVKIRPFPLTLHVGLTTGSYRAACDRSPHHAGLSAHSGPGFQYSAKAQLDVVRFVAADRVSFGRHCPVILVATRVAFPLYTTTSAHSLARSV